MKIVAGLALMLALGGCATVQSARAHLVKTPPRCVDQTAAVYFEPGAAELTQEGRLIISHAASQAVGCKVISVDVVGLSDAAGDPQANLELSKKRAEAVAAALAANGLPPADFKVGAAGQAGAVTPGGQAQPLRRRVDVTLHLTGRS